MKKGIVTGTPGLLLILLLVAVTVIAGNFSTPLAKSQEARIAHFEEDYETFVEQVEKSSGEYVEDAGTPIFDNQPVDTDPPKVDPSVDTHVLGTQSTTPAAEKWIEVDTSDQKLTTWEGTTKIKEYPVSTGLPGTPTVKGTFWVWRKVLNQPYRGGSRALGTYYYLPNVPYSLFFHGGYAIHGAYWHNDFGIRPRSHGCVNMRIEDAKEVYEFANPVMPPGFTAINSERWAPGTRIVVHD